MSGAGGSKVCRAQGQLKSAWLLWAKSVPHRTSGLATHLYLIEMYPGLTSLSGAHLAALWLPESGIEER